MADDLVILAQFVKLGRLRKKVFMELAQKEISQICKLGEKKGKYCTSSTYHAVYDLIDKGLVEYVDPDSKRRREVRLTDLGYNVFEKLDIESCWDENNPGDVRSFDERLKQKLTPEEYELITSWR